MKQYNKIEDPYLFNLKINSYNVKDTCLFYVTIIPLLDTYYIFPQLQSFIIGNQWHLNRPLPGIKKLTFEMFLLLLYLYLLKGNKKKFNFVTPK